MLAEAIGGMENGKSGEYISSILWKQKLLLPDPLFER